jgi:hypothetical protein
MAIHGFRAGQWVIYRKPKTSVSPGSRAKDVRPATKGESYSYVVDKFWVVTEVLADNRLRLRTRRGKEHLVDAGDCLLRPANWWERWWFRRRFLAVAESREDT